jgi:sulfite reductase alpha subunit-like flavoprotein
MADNRPPLLILYGTQTGTAQEVAEQIAREGKQRHFKTRVISMEDYPVVRPLVN